MEEKYERNVDAENEVKTENPDTISEYEENNDDIIEQIVKQEKRTTNKKFGPFSMQLSVCIILVTIILLSKVFLPGIYTNITEKYKEAFISESNLLDIEEIKDKILNAINGITPISRGDSDEESSESEEPSSSVDEVVSEEGAGGEQNSISDSESDVPTDSTLDEVAFPDTLQKPIDGSLTSTFGFREYPLNGEPDFHKGIDIQAEEGTKIKAAYGGVVTVATYSTSYGNYIVIDHENGFNTLYAHCKNLLSEEGDTVKKGKTIATVGSTGASTGNHLHFAIKYNGLWVNPLYSFAEDAYAAI